jgi:acetyltransferase-like isoleucine patch superfamily enzyme
MLKKSFIVSLLSHLQNYRNIMLKAYHLNYRGFLLEQLRYQVGLLRLVYDRLYYWFFIKLFFGSQIYLIGKAAARIHPSTHLVIHKSKIIIENGVLSFGFLPGWGFKQTSILRLSNSTLRIEGNVELRPGVRLWAFDSNVVIGNGTVINVSTSIVSKIGVRIGADCLIGMNTSILDCDMHKHAVVGEKPEDIAKEIIIKDHCWVGDNVTILKGVTIGEGSIVGAHSVVTKDVEARTMVAGVPARKIKDNVVWEQ